MTEYKGIKLIVDPTVTLEEMKIIAENEIAEWEGLGKEISSISIKIDGPDLLVQIEEKSPIKRVRRITGYLSNIENFNPGKKAECKDRYKHYN